MWFFSYYHVVINSIFNVFFIYNPFLVDHEKENKKKKAKVRNVPPLFDLLESARSLHKKGNKKESMQSASKIHAKVYK